MVARFMQADICVFYDQELSQSVNCGTPTTEVGNLENIRSFYINSNDITGTIPSVIGNLKKIRTFDISYNDIT